MSTVDFDRTLEPFFFGELFGVWRAPKNIARVWVVCPPFAEEEKSARRTLVTLCDALAERGDASLVFSLRGTGDSGGDFREATLTNWQNDVRAACDEARRRAPDAELCLCGLRLGAGLGQSIVAEVQATRCVWIEPVFEGRAVLQEIKQKKRLRAMMTKNEGGGDALPDDDFDGWPITESLRASLEGFLSAPNPEISSLIIGVGPRAELSTPHARWAEEANAQKLALKMPAFWNRLDTVSAQPLLETIPQW
ncbi:MAG TPA: hypothetical protein VF681_03055 [Abditibacteriaceae bacterium]|jgi:hypothetical protein